MKLSIIIPLAPEENAWQQLLPQLSGIDSNTEVLLVDSSCTSTLTNEDWGNSQLKHIQSDSGRANSMNNGAQQAHGEYLWFLHADTQLKCDTLTTVYKLINQHHIKDSIWYFDLRFLDDGPPNMAINTLGVYIRSHYFGMPFGDQAFLMKKSLFENIGQYNEDAAYGEDHLLIWQAYQHGFSVKPVGASIKTSARKYLIKGRWPTTKKHLALTYSQAWQEIKKLIKIKLS